MAQDADRMSFEDLLSVYRTEMKTQGLTDVRRDIYSELTKLQERIRSDYETEYSRDPDSIICEGINERRKKVAIYIEKVVDLRMEKVVVMALRASAGASNILEKLTNEEKEFYELVTSESKKYRARMLKGRKSNYVIPDISSNAVKEERVPEAGTTPEMNAVRTESNDIRADEIVIPDDDAAADVVKDVGVIGEGEILIEHPPHVPEEPREEMLVIRMTEDVGRIAGPDCDYDLKKEVVVRMPATLANALIKREKAVLLNVTP
ncbi:MAG: hypothetical protein FWG58_01225 [Methanomassiliicoccaceae archaeon]|nr:hypothetical protein [Methanomassiliicoccaceae archaeon]